MIMNTMKTSLHRVAGLILVAILWVLAPVAFAGNATWSGGANNNWTDAGNWLGGAYPGATSGTTNPDIASFTNNPTNKSPVFNVADINLGGFIFDTGAGAFTLGTVGGNAVLLSSGGSITVNSGDTAAQIVNAPLVIQNDSGGSSGVYTNLNNSATTAAILTLGGSIKGMATTGNTTALTIGGVNVGANTVSGIISDGTAGGAVSLTKAGSGKWVLSGTNSYSGATVVNGGIVVSSAPQVNGTLQITGTMTNTSSVSIANGGTLIDGSSTAASNTNVTNRINPAATLTMGGSNGGGTFTLAAPAAGNTHSQTLAGLAIGAGGNIINASAATGTMNLNFNGAGGSVYSRSTGGTVTFATGTAGFNVSFANAPTGAGVSGSSSPILIGATLGGTTLGGTDFVVANSGTVAAPTYDTTLTADKNVNVIGNLSGGPLSINSLRLGNTTKCTVTLTGTNSIASGGILLPSTVTTDNLNHTITGGYLTSGTGDLWIYSASVASLTRSGGNGDARTANYAITVASSIIDNGTTPVSLTIGGNGYSQVLISGANTYSGGTYLANGMLVINADNNLGASNGAVTVTSGANNYLRLNNAITSSRDFVINSGAVLTTGGYNLTLNGSLTGGGALLIGYYGGNNVLILNNAENGFTGTYTVASFLRANEGVGLSSNANLDLTGNYNSVANGAGALETSANVTRSVGTEPGQVQFTAGANSYGGGFSAVNGPVTVSLGGLGTPTALTYCSGAFYGGSTGGGIASGLVLQDANANNTLTWANPINNNGKILYFNQAAPTAVTNTAVTMTGVLSGTGTMVKEGLGLLILAGPNTYTGQTRIQKGTLSVASFGSVNGAASNLGQPSSAANGTIVMGVYGSGGGNAAALIYTGSGETTDRILDIATTIGKITLEQAGTGLLKFTSPIVVSAVGDAGKTLILQGSTSGTGELSGGVIDGTNFSNVAAAALGADRLAIIAPADSNYGQLRVGNRVSGKGIAPGTYLTALAGGTTGVLSKVTTEALTNGQQVVFTGFTTVTKNGTNLWNVLGANTYSGITTVSNGVLGLSGNLGSNIVVKSGAKLSAGAAGGVGTLSTAGLMTFETNSRLLVDVASGTADTITAVGNVTLTGMVTLEVSDDQLRGGSWKVLESTGGTISGTFVLSGARSGSTLTKSVNSKEIWLTIPPKGTMIRFL